MILTAFYAITRCLKIPTRKEKKIRSLLISSISNVQFLMPICFFKKRINLYHFIFKPKIRNLFFAGLIQLCFSFQSHAKKTTIPSTTASSISSRQEIQELRHQVQELQSRLIALESQITPPKTNCENCGVAQAAGDLSTKQPGGKEKKPKSQVSPLISKVLSPSKSDLASTLPNNPEDFSCSDAQARSLSHPKNLRTQSSQSKKPASHSSSLPPSYMPDVYNNSLQSLPPGWKKGPFPEARPFNERDSVAVQENYYEKGIQSLNYGNVVLSRELFQKVPSGDPSYGQALYWLGMIAMLQYQEYAKASTFFSKAYRKCEKKQPKFALLALLKLAESLFYQNKMEAAKTVLNQCKRESETAKVEQRFLKEMQALELRIQEKI